MGWFRVACCEKCWGAGSRSERGVSLGAEQHAVLDTPSIASIPMQMMRGRGPYLGGAWGLEHIGVSLLFGKLPKLVVVVLVSL